MKWSSRVSYFLAGACFTNAVPHLVIAATGRRNLTPFGRDSSPGVNLLWSGINFASGYLLVRFADKHAGESSTHTTTWLVPYETGRFCWSLFGVSYAWLTAGVKGQKPKEASDGRTRGRWKEMQSSRKKRKLVQTMIRFSSFHELILLCILWE